MKLELNKKYVSSLIANTDLHGGGLFFCIIYQKCLEFENKNKVWLTNRIVDAFRPMDDLDVIHLKNYRIEGKYFYNDRGYLICDFKTINLTYTGISTDKNPEIIPFNIYSSKFLSSNSLVFQLEK